MTRTLNGRKPDRLFGLGPRLDHAALPLPAPPLVCIGRVNSVRDASPTGRHRREWQGWHVAPNPQFAMPLWWCRDCGEWELGQGVERRGLLADD